MQRRHCRKQTCRRKTLLCAIGAQTRGTSMVEVLVAIVIVVLMTAGFSRIVTSSVQLMQSALRLQKSSEQFQEAYYKTTAYAKRSEPGSVVIKDLNLKLDTEKTHARNKAVLNTPLKLYTESKVVYWTDTGAGRTGYTQFSVLEKTYP